MSERGKVAIARIEKALMRIEALGPIVKGDPQTALAFAELKMRHQALSSESRAAMAELDALIDQVRAN
jgi:hypothetical protein